MGEITQRASPRVREVKFPRQPADTVVRGTVELDRLVAGARGGAQGVRPSPRRRLAPGHSRAWGSAAAPRHAAPRRRVDATASLWDPDDRAAEALRARASDRPHARSAGG